MDYVEMAKKKAEDKREKTKAARERDRVERECKEKRKQEIYNELVEGMEQWDNVLNFRVVVFSIDNPFVHINVYRDKSIYMTLCIKWDKWDVSYSDECHSTVEGFVLDVSYLDWRDEVKEIFRGNSLVEDALAYIAEHMSKYF